MSAISYYSTKTFSGSVKDVDVKSRIVTGYFASFDNIDSDGEMFIKGAFKKSIGERGPDGTNRIYHLKSHNILEPLGKPIILKEDRNGLYFETKITETAYGTDVLKLYADEVYNEHSVGYKTIIEEMVENPKITYNELREVKLFEGSTVTLGANFNTPFLGFKGEVKKEDIIDRLELLTKALKNGTFTDETFEMLEIEFKQLQSLLQPLVDANTEEPDTGLEFIEAFKRELNTLN